MNRLGVFLLAPLPAAAIGGLVSWGTGAHSRGVSVAFFYLLQLYALQIVVGLAIYAWLRRTGRGSIISYMVGGLVMVAIVAVPYLLWASFRPENTIERAVVVLLLWLTFGAVTGASAWFLSRRRQRSN
jgi:hypothetical protein